MKSLFLLFLLFFALTPSLHAQKYKEMFLHVDSSNFGTSNQFFMDIIRIKKKGKQVLTDRFSSRRDWKDFWVTMPDYMRFNMGICTFDMALVSPENQLCTIKIKDEDSGLEKSIQFKIPYVSGLNLTTNAVEANRYRPLDYNLLLSNGKTIAGSFFLPPNNLELRCPNVDLFAHGSEIYLDLTRPYHLPSINVEFYNKNTGRFLGSQAMQIQYPSAASFNWSGYSGSNGSNGSNGSTPSGNASSGTRGTDASSGTSGSIFVYQMNVNNESFLILKIFKSDENNQTEVLKYQGAIFSIESVGGSGGDGGSGGNGGDGKVDKANNIDSPYAGNGGDGSSGGDAGNGGNIQIFFHESVFYLADKFEVRNNAGMPGSAGKAGKAGKGDYTNAKLIGVLLSTKAGVDGTPGVAGKYATDGNTEKINVLSTDFDLLLQQYEEKGYYQSR